MVLLDLRRIGRRHANLCGDSDHWIVVDVRARRVTGPLTDSALAARPELAMIRTLSPDSPGGGCRRDQGV